MILRPLPKRINTLPKPFEITEMTLTKEMVKAWEPPPFQRRVSVTREFRKLLEQIKRDGYIVSAIYLGIWNGKTYIVDGNHRTAAFFSSERSTMRAPVIIRHYVNGPDGLIQMCEDFLSISKHIKPPRPDDMLKALGATTGHVGLIEKACPFIGYSNLWKGKEFPVVNMARVIRCLAISKQDVPNSPSAGALDLARALTPEDTHCLITFMRGAFRAWGRDAEFRPMWGTLNLTLGLWFYRRMTSGPDFHGKGEPMSPLPFSRYLVALAMSDRYRSLMAGKSGMRMHDPDTRNPVCREFMRVFARKLKKENLKNIFLPIPKWPGL